MPAKRIFNVNDFLALLHKESTLPTGLSTGSIARKIRCNRGTALKYLKELKAEKQITETRISNTLNLWKLTYSENQIMIGDCAETLKQLPDESVDLIVTDPPYGYNFMGLSWDRALPSLAALKECCRVLKAGAFAFFMCSSRTDLLWRMGERLEKAGFETGFSNISWIYSTGFPKSANVSKLLNKRAENTSEAETFKGSFTVHQLKPAMEHILVCMKPLSTKTYLDQALINGKGISWLDDCRIPYASDSDIPNQTVVYSQNVKYHENRLGRPWSDERVAAGIPTQIYEAHPDGRFPANFLVCDDALNNGITNHGTNELNVRVAGEGSYSRYFDLDSWFKAKLPEQAQKTFPALIVPKPHKNEKSKYIENTHPTVKPLKLMSYLITMGSREGDLVLDPFCGSGTTLEAANLLKRRFTGCELDEKWKPIIEARAFKRSKAV